MMPRVNPEDFQIHVELISQALTLQNPGIVEQLSYTLIRLLSVKYTEDVLEESAHQLAEDDPEVYQWAIQHVQAFKMLGQDKLIHSQVLWEDLKLGLVGNTPDNSRRLNAGSRALLP
jgi:hypothetical protein